jgi:hypothetical protein
VRRIKNEDDGRNESHYQSIEEGYNTNEAQKKKSYEINNLQIDTRTDTPNQIY